MPCRCQRLNENGKFQLLRQGLRLTKPAHQFGLEIDDAGVSFSGCYDEERVLEAVLNVVAEPDEEFDVGSKGVVGLELELQNSASSPKSSSLRQGCVRTAF